MPEAGQIGNLQLVVSNNAEHEREYSTFIAGLFRYLCALEASQDLRPKNSHNWVRTTLIITGDTCVSTGTPRQRRSYRRASRTPLPDRRGFSLPWAR
jgi:hypothetical protein